MVVWYKLLAGSVSVFNAMLLSSQSLGVVNNNLACAKAEACGATHRGSAVTCDYPAFVIACLLNTLFSRFNEYNNLYNLIGCRRDSIMRITQSITFSHNNRHFYSKNPLSTAFIWRQRPSSSKYFNIVMLIQNPAYLSFNELFITVRH